MFLLLESSTEIFEAQRKLEATLRREFQQTAVKDIGYPGGTRRNAEVRTDGKYWFWSDDYDAPSVSHPRRLNWFGLYREKKGTEISVEINTAYEGRKQSVAGFFARDADNGGVYLLHSGGVGGGQKGVGKDSFLLWSSFKLESVVDSDGKVREGVLVMPIESLDAGLPVRRYIDKVVDFKRAVRAGETLGPEFQRKQKKLKEFHAEPRGRRTGQRASEIDYLTRHGEVVDALKSWRVSRSLPEGGRVVNDFLIDMGVEVAGEWIEVFEVKTTSARADIYKAVGQLMVHGTRENCERKLVLPKQEPVANDLMDALRRLDIELLRFELDAKRATIL